MGKLNIENNVSSHTGSNFSGITVAMCYVIRWLISPLEGISDYTQNDRNGSLLLLHSHETKQDTPRVGSKTLVRNDSKRQPYPENDGNVSFPAMEY